MLREVNRRYFLKAVQGAKIKKDTPYEIQCNCPLCGDKKYRLHLYHNKQKNIDLVHCFNAGCVLDSPMTFKRALPYLNPSLEEAYKKETLMEIISNSYIKEDNPLKSLLQKKKSAVADTGIDFLHFFRDCKKSKRCLEYLKKRLKWQSKDDFSRDFQILGNVYYNGKKEETRFFEHSSEKDKKHYVKDSIIIPIRDKGREVGFYSRALEDRRFSTFLLPDIPKFWKNCPVSEMQIVTESIFDSVSTGFENIGAMLSADTPPEISPPENCIVAFDNDKTGFEKLYKEIENTISGKGKYKRFFIWPYSFRGVVIEEKDFNELLQRLVEIEKMPRKEVLRFIKEMIEYNTEENAIKAFLKLKEKGVKI